jgi:regulator of replication initiation timing
VAERAYQEEIARLRRENEKLRAEIERLRKLLEDALRSSKRNVACVGTLCNRIVAVYQDLLYLFSVLRKRALLRGAK